MPQNRTRAFLEDNMTDGMIPVNIDITKHGDRIHIRISNKGVSMTLMFDASDLDRVLDGDDGR